MKKMKQLISLVLLSVLVISFCSCQALMQGRTEHRVQWWLDEINWNQNRKNYTGKGVTIAVIDSGIDAQHPDLKGKIISEHRVASLPKEASAYLGHGTAVAGIIAASPADENGVLGIAPDVTILSIDVTDDPDGLVDVNALIEGIKYAIDQNVQIINISLGFNEYNQELEDAVNTAIDKNIIVVASAGNEMTNTVLYPAKFDGVFCVGSYNKKGDIISPKNGGEQVVYMPGEYIVTTYSGDSGYISAGGTSISTPIFSGIVALILQKDPDATSDAIRQVLKKTILFDVKKIVENI